MRFSDFERACQSGSRQEQLDVLTDIYFTSYLNNFERLFKDCADVKLLLDMLKAITHSDELSRALYSSNQIINILHYIQNLPSTTTEKSSNVLTSFLEIMLKFGPTTTYSEEFFSIIMSYVPSNDLQLSEIACHIIEQFLKQSPRAYIRNFLSIIHSYKNNIIILLRYCTITCKVIAVSDDHFTIFLQSGATDVIWGLCAPSDPGVGGSSEGGDILTQVVAIEMLRYFAYTKTGLHCLFTSNIFKWLVSTAYNTNDDTTGKGQNYDPLLSSQCLREISEIFSKAAINHIIDSTFWSSNLVESDLLTKFINIAITYIDSISDENRLTGITVITDFIRTSYYSLNILINNTSLLQSWTGLINSGKVSIQVAVLHSFARVFECDYTTPPTTTTSTYSGTGATTDLSAPKATTDQVNLSEIDSKKLKLWTIIGENKNTSTITYLMRLVHQPVAEPRFAALDIMCAILKNDEIGTTATAPTTSLTSTTSTSAAEKAPTTATAGEGTTATATTAGGGTGAGAVRVMGLQLLCSSTEFREYAVYQESEVRLLIYIHTLIHTRLYIIHTHTTYQYYVTRRHALLYYASIHCIFTHTHTLITHICTYAYR